MLNTLPALTLIATGGLAILLVGGTWTINGAVNLARHLGVSPLMIGMTIIAFGTSAPELVVSIQALWKEAPDIVVGNVLGSNVANILLIVGIAAAIKTLAIPGGTQLRRDYKLLLVFTVIYVLVLCCFQKIPGLLGILMLIGLAGYTVWSFRSSRREERLGGAQSASGEETGEKELTLGAAIFYTLIGILGIVIGAYFLLEGSVGLARRLGISEVVIGLTVIAIGTSLPELAASVMAAIRGHPGLAIGNIMGSNLFNMFGVTGVAAAVSPFFVGPLQVPLQVIHFDLWVMLGATLLICVILLCSRRIVRLGGLGMVIIYVLYIAAVFSETTLAASR